MTNTYKILGQNKPSAATLTSLYTVPSSTQSIPKELTVCNQSATPTTIRVAVRLAGAAISAEMYLYYDMALGGNETLILPVPPMGATDILSVYATLATVSFVVGGVEIT